jgi:flagellar motor switch/type III secretory pathway protein FliN
VIADLRFEDARSGRVRPATFVPRASVPLSAACVVANGLRETLREVLGGRCDLVIGEPVAIRPEAWALLSRQAHCFLTLGRQTDIVLVIPDEHARRLVLGAFGEGEAVAAATLSALEREAVDRIAARCATAFDPLCIERRGPPQRLAAAAVPPCVAYFDVRVRAPITIDLGIGIVRDLPDPGPAGALPPHLLGPVAVDLRVEFAQGTTDLATLLRLAPGDVLPLDTQVGAPGTLKIYGRSIARGVCGASGGRYSFEVHAVQRSMGGRS